MGRNSKIRFECDADRPGLLMAIRDRGKITFGDLLDAINSRDVDFQGHIFSMQFIVDRERLGPIGYMDEDEPEDDVWELWDVIDGEPCPLCGKLSRHTFCPDCGKYVFPDDL